MSYSVHTPSSLSSSMLHDLTTVLTDPIRSVMPIGRKRGWCMAGIRLSLPSLLWYLYLKPKPECLNQFRIIKLQTGLSGKHYPVVKKFCTHFLIRRQINPRYILLKLKIANDIICKQNFVSAKYNIT